MRLNSLLFWLIRTFLTALLWIFILSINIKGRTAFSYAHEVLVQNPVIEMLDDELSEVWERVYIAARKAFVEEDEIKKKEVF